MNNLAGLVQLIARLTGAPVEAKHYTGFYSRKLTLNSSLAVKRASHSYHIEVTDPTGPMLVFPVITSSAYEANPTTDEKRRYYAKLGVRIFRANLLDLTTFLAENHTSNLDHEAEYYRGEMARLSAGHHDWIRSWTHATFQIRGTGQRQLEIGTGSDHQDFIHLRRCLRPDDLLVFMKSGPADYDVFGLQGESLPAGDWEGYAIGAPGEAPRVVGSDVVRTEARGAGQTALLRDTDRGPATEKKIAQVISTVERYGRRAIVALAGVPGTGKSFIASIVAERLTGHPEKVREVQFHPSYTYEEFMEGLRFDEKSAVSVKPGILLEWNDKALADPDSRYVLLVEELTRANLSAVLGELMTYIEYRDREFITPYARKKIRIAPNLLVLATYNPTDRSAIEIDDALLRRLRVVEFFPSTAQLEEMLGTSIPADVLGNLKSLFDACAKKFSEYESRMPFGHGIFAGITREFPDLYDLWHERIKHILRRPLAEPHDFTTFIEELYVWRVDGAPPPAAGPQL